MSSPQPNSYKAFMLGTSVTVVLMLLLAGAFFGGLRIGRRQGMRQALGAITGDQTATASAALSPRFSARGKISAINGMRLIVDTPVGNQRELILTSSSQIVLQDQGAISIDEVHVGDRVLGIGKPGENMGLTVTLLRILK